ncbi:unnamed protein product, partial [Meganyctiphanes norvegica]
QLRPVIHQQLDTAKLQTVVHQPQSSLQLLPVVLQKEDTPKRLPVVHWQETPQKRPVFHQGHSTSHGLSEISHQWNPPPLRPVVYQQLDTIFIQTVDHQQQSSPQLLTVVRQPTYIPRTVWE